MISPLGHGVALQIITQASPNKTSLQNYSRRAQNNEDFYSIWATVHPFQYFS
jgi:hypothetical protein